MEKDHPGNLFYLRFKESSGVSRTDFSPPTLIEKFQQPIIKSEPFTFEVTSAIR